MFDYFVGKKPQFYKLAITALAGFYFFRYIKNPETWGILDSFNLLMHEAGHWIFGIFGETIGVLGGSLNQIFIPALFFLYFFLRQEKYSAGLLLFLLGHNFLNVAHYAGDATVMQLPLIGGNENVIHDWNYLLIKFGLLHQTNEIAELIKFLGILTFALAIYFCFKYSFQKKQPEIIIGNEFKK